MNRAVASLAMVKTAFSKYKRDYIENFVPFVATLIKKRRYREIDCKDLQPFIDDFQQEFGLIIPYHPMLTILERTRKRGIVKRAYSKLIPKNEKVLQYDFSDVALKKDAETNEVLSNFINFCRNEYSYEITLQEAQEGFISFLRAHDLDILFASQNRTLLPEFKTSRRMKYLLAAFINEARSSLPQIFDSIIELCTGHVLANTILYAEDFSKFKGKLRNLELYLDTQFIFRLFGIEDELYRKTYRDLVSSIKEQQAKLYVFRHTFDEITSIFRSCLTWIHNPDYDSTKASSVLQYFVYNGKNESDIHQYLATIDNKLQAYGIEIKDSPDFAVHPEFQIDENELNEKIVEVYSHKPSFDESDKQFTIERDVKSISSIYHLRKGRTPQTIKQAGSLFVTTNFTLASASKMFEDEYPDKQLHIPVCITDVFLGTLIWMQSPVKWTSLNEKKVIADCVAALQPDNLFVKRLVDEAMKLKDSGKVSDDEFLAVSRSYFVQEMLMEETLGDPESITSRSIEDIIQKIRFDAAYLPNQQLKLEKERVQELESKISTYEHLSAKRRSDLEMSVRKKVETTLKIAFVILIIILITSIVVPFLPNIKLAWKIIWIILVAFFTVLSVGYGCNLKGLRMQIVEWLCNKITEYLRCKLSI